MRVAGVSRLLVAPPDAARGRANAARLDATSLGHLVAFLASKGEDRERAAADAAAARLRFRETRLPSGAAVAALGVLDAREGCPTAALAPVTPTALDADDLLAHDFNAKDAAEWVRLREKTAVFLTAAPADVGGRITRWAVGRALPPPSDHAVHLAGPLASPQASEEKKRTAPRAGAAGASPPGESPSTPTPVAGGLTRARSAPASPTRSTKGLQSRTNLRNDPDTPRRAA